MNLTDVEDALKRLRERPFRTLLLLAVVLISFLLLNYLIGYVGERGKNAASPIRSDSGTTSPSLPPAPAPNGGTTVATETVANATSNTDQRNNTERHGTNGVSAKIVRLLQSDEPWFDSSLPRIDANTGIHQVVGTVAVEPIEANQAPMEFFLEWWLLRPDGDPVYLTRWRDGEKCQFRQRTDGSHTYWAKNKTIWTDQLGVYEWRVRARDEDGSFSLLASAKLAVD